MEEKKQKLLKLIDNLDWDKFLEYSGKHGAFNTKYGSILYDLEKYQKQPTIEQRLKDLGFKASLEAQDTKKGLYYKSYGDKDFRIYYIPHTCELPGSMIYSYTAIFPKSNAQIILNFANYLITIQDGDIK